jgi:hypothetical protein
MTPHFNSHRREGATAGSLAGREQFDVAPPVLLENRVATEERSRHSRGTPSCITLRLRSPNAACDSGDGGWRGD